MPWSCRTADHIHSQTHSWWPAGVSYTEHLVRTREAGCQLRAYSAHYESCMTAEMHAYTNTYSWLPAEDMYCVQWKLLNSWEHAMCNVCSESWWTAESMYCVMWELFDSWDACTYKHINLVTSWEYVMCTMTALSSCDHISCNVGAAGQLEQNTCAQYASSCNASLRAAFLFSDKIAYSSLCKPHLRDAHLIMATMHMSTHSSRSVCLCVCLCVCVFVCVCVRCVYPRVTCTC